MQSNNFGLHAEPQQQLVCQPAIWNPPLWSFQSKLCFMIIVGGRQKANQIRCHWNR